MQRKSEGRGARDEVYINQPVSSQKGNLVLFFVQFWVQKLLFLIFFGFCHNFLKKEVAFIFNVYIMDGAKKKN